MLFMTLVNPRDLHSAPFIPDSSSQVFYDVVIPDAFRNPFQKMPLDHDTDDFYANRSEAVDARLDQIEGADDAELGEMIRDRWVGGAGNSIELEEIRNIAFRTS